MRAVTVVSPGGLDRLKLVEAPDAAPPRPGQIQVKLKASSLNYHDYLVANGTIKTEDGRIPMSDGAGEVVAVGDGVLAFRPGDRVVSTFFLNWPDGRPRVRNFNAVPGDGTDGYARETVTAPAHAFTHAPKGYSDAEAATLTCAGLTAWRSLVVLGGLKAGDVVLVQGSGGVSVFALQFARMFGARVIATSSSEAKAERLKALGAEHVINYKTDQAWGATVQKLTDGLGVDHVVEIGGAGTLGQSLQAVRVGGHISLIGVLAGFHGPVPTALLMTKQVRVIGVTVGSRADQLDMVRAIDANGLKPVIDVHFPLEALADAFRHQEAGRHFGKIALDI